MRKSTSNWRVADSEGPEDMASNDFRTDADLACRAAEEFVSLYYETIDKRRRQLTKLYMDTATLVWNGNPISGQNALIEFLKCYHQVNLQ